MPSYAYVKAPLKCPSCATELTDLVSFQWAYLPGQLPRQEYVYRVGDSLYWKKCTDGSIIAWALFHGAGINAGDPAISDLIARDSFHLFLTEPCPNCGTKLGGAAVEIHSQKITSVWLAPPNEFAEDISQVDIYTYDDRGNRVPRRDLTDHPLVPAGDCLK